jgi:branched-chain amino acid transport system substrate-binding protein
MRKCYILAGLVVALLVVALAAAACGGTTTTTTTAAPTTTTAPSTETTQATETTTAPTTETTVAGPATGEPIKIGLSISQTGSGAAPAKSFEQGIKVQIEMVNASGGINNRPLELVEYDDKSDVPTLVANLNKLIQQDKVFATIGPFIQYGQEAARQIAEQTQTPMVGNGPATVKQLEAKPQYQWSVMTASGASVQGDALAKFIEAQGYKNVLGLADVLDIDQETLDVVGQAASSGGYTFTKMPDSFGFDQQDFQPILNKMMEQIDKLKPDAIITYVNPIAFPVIYKGLRGLNVTVPIIGGTSCAIPWIFGGGPEAVEGAYVPDSGGNANPQALPDTWPAKPLQLAFAQAYQAKYNAGPDFFAADGSDLVTVLVAAMKQAGEIDKAKVAQALINLKDLPTLEGIMTWTPDATSMGVHGNMVMWQVKNGQFELVMTLN